MHRPNQLIHLTGAIFITLLAVGCNADIVTPTDTPIVHVTTAVSSPATVTSTSVSATAFAVEYSATSTGPALTSTRTTDQLALTPEATPVSRAGVTVIFEKAAIVDQFDLSGSINLSDLSNAIPAAWRVSSNSAPRYVIQLQPVPLEVERCQYEGGSLVFRITPDVAVSIIDNENGQTVGATRLDGRAPEACKAVESFLNQPLLGPTGSKALIGTPPDPKSLVDWLVLTVVHSKLDLTLDSIPDIAWPVLPILDLGFAPDGKTLGLLGQDGTVKLLEVMPGLTVRQTIGTQGDGVKVLDFSPSGKQIALGTQAGELQIWDLATGSKTNSFNDPVGKEIRRLAFSPNGQLLAAADKDNTINVWDVTTGKIDYTLSHSQGLKVAFAPDGQILAWANSVRSVEFVDAITGKPVATLQQTEIVVSPLSFSPDGKTMAVQLGNCQVAVFQVSTRQLLRNMGNDACRPFGISGAVVSPDGTTLAMTGSPSDRNAADQNAFLKFWDVETGQALRTIRVNQQAIANLVFSQHGLVAGSHGGAVTLWDVATGQQLSEYQNTVNPP